MAQATHRPSSGRYGIGLEQRLAGSRTREGGSLRTQWRRCPSADRLGGDRREIAYTGTARGLEAGPARSEGAES